MDVIEAMEMRWEVGDVVCVMKRKGRVVGRAVVESEEADGRWRVRYGDGSWYKARKENLMPLFKGTVAVRTTEEYRLMTAQVTARDAVVEIGCDTGETCKRLAKVAERVVGIDKAPSRIAAARANVPSCDFIVADIFRDEISDEIFAASVVFVDINGSRDIAAVLRALQWVHSHFQPRLTVVKSVQLVISRFPYLKAQPHVPRRQLPPSPVRLLDDDEERQHFLSCPTTTTTPPRP